jgi:predicted GIY-YIG superfamily endonuclease
MGKAEAHALNFKDAIRSTLYVDRVRMKKLSSGIVRMNFEYGEHLRAFASLADIPPATSPDMLAIGVKEDGSVFELPIGKSVLAVGLTGTGKSSFAWALVYALIRSGIPFRLTIGDPKFVEWKIAKESIDASPIVYQYTDSPYQLGKGGLGEGQFMWKIQKDLTDKLNRIPVGQRIATPSEADPLDIVIIDETLPLTAELKSKGAQHPLVLMTYQGRAAGSWCIFLSQTAEKEVIGPVRDLVPIALCFAVKSREQADMALGSGAVNKGLTPHLLDAIDDVGICYYSLDTGNDGAARIGFATDYDIPYLIMGQIPPEKTVVDKYSYDRPCYVYEYYGPDENGNKELKYIGEAYDWEKRYKQHEEKEPEMMKEIVKAWTEVDLWPSKASAETEEMIRIKKKHPKWNRQHNGSHYRGT